MNTKTLMMAALVAIVLGAPTVAADYKDVLNLLTNNGGASTSCGQTSTSAHGWGSGPSASADMTAVTSSGSYGSGSDAYAWANGFGGGSASAQGGVWTAYCNSALLGIINANNANVGLACSTAAVAKVFDGIVMTATSTGAAFITDGVVGYALDGIVDLGSASSVTLPLDLVDSGVAVHYSNGPTGCSAIAV